MRIGINGAQDFLALVVRRKWWVIFPFIALSCAVGVITFVLPKTYVSEALVLIRPRDVPEDFVKDLIAGTAEERVRAIQQTVESRTNLLSILREFADDLPEFKRLNMDEQVLKLRNQINISFQLEKSDGKTLPLTYFRISYQNQNPELAMKIAGKLTALFIEQDNQARESQVVGTTEFLAAELSKVSEELNQSEAQLKEVKSARQFELPSQLDTNQKALDRLGTDKKTNAEAMDRSEAAQLSLENQLAQTPEMISKPAMASQAKSVDPPVIDEYRKASAEYDQAAAKFTSKHPEVQGAKAKLDRLKARMTPEQLILATSEVSDGKSTVPSADTMMPNQLYQSLLSQLNQVKTDLEIRRKEKVWIESEIAKYSRRIEDTPNAEQAIADVVRQNDDLKKQYEGLKSKLAEARLSESLESKQKGTQFFVVDPANYPLSPDKPNKLAVFFGGSILSLLFSIAVAAVVDVSRQRIWTQSEIEAFWGVPVLVEIPSIVTDTDLAAEKKRGMAFAFTALFASGLYSAAMYVLYLKHGFILRALDPVLQKVVYK